MRGRLTSKPKEGDIKIWWVPQIPGKPFEVSVPSLVAGKFLLTLLAEYDLFQLEQKVKPDYSNAGGLCQYKNGDWEDWYDPDDDTEFDKVGYERLARIDKEEGRTHELRWVR